MGSARASSWCATQAEVALVAGRSSGWEMDLEVGVVEVSGITIGRKEGSFVSALGLER